MPDSPAPSPRALPDVQRLAIALSAAGFQTVTIAVSPDPQVEDDAVHLAGGYYVQCGSLSTYFEVHRQSTDNEGLLVEHLHMAASVAGTVAWCVANLPAAARGPVEG